jgi:hypothetical protein
MESISQTTGNSISEIGYVNRRWGLNGLIGYVSERSSRRRRSVHQVLLAEVSTRKEVTYGGED